MKSAKILLAVALICPVALLVINKNPELYKIMPGFIVEGEIGDRIIPGMGVGVSEAFTILSDGRGASLVNYVIPFPGRPDVLFYNDMRGVIGVIEGGRPRELLFMNAKALFGDRFKSGNLELGLISFAFHPDFLISGAPGEEKIYTVHSERPSALYLNSAIPYFGLASQKADHLSVVSEWSMSAEEPAQIDPRSQRVVLVLEQPFYDHNIYHIAFNPASLPGDPDYGLLYVGVGSGGRQSNLELDNTTLFGKILRIDPVGDGNPGYTVPPSNPFVSSDDMRPEVWAYGFRNPQQFSWDPKSGWMYAADIGHASLEEIDIVQAGKNYGWSYFEGRYLVSRESLERVRQSLLPLMFFPITLPVVEYDHGNGKAVAGGFVYRGKGIPELSGKYVFGDIVNGRLFYFDAGEAESGGAPELFELYLFTDSRPTSMADLIGEKRVDLRLGLDAQGELLLLNKHDNIVRRIGPQ